MSLHAPSSPSPSRDADPIAPELPHHMASTRQHTADEVLAMMNSTPLFMTELPEGSGAGGSNDFFFLYYLFSSLIRDVI